MNLEERAAAAAKDEKRKMSLSANTAISYCRLQAKHLIEELLTAMTNL